MSLRRRLRARPCLEVLEDRCVPATFVVTTTFDSQDANDGLLSLREALLAANATPNINATPDRIEFNLPTSDFGYNANNGPAGAWTFSRFSAFPAITEAVVIDGYSQPGSSGNTLAASNDAVLRVEITGGQAFASPGLTLSSPGSTVRGLVINTINTAIQILSDNNTIAGNFLGTSVTALSEDTIDVPAIFGITVTGSGNTIGGLSPADRNLIVGRIDSIRLTSATNTVIQGNFIGTNKLGTTDINRGNNPNDAGIIVTGSNNTTIGGTVPGAGNVISGAQRDGIAFLTMGVGNRVQGNLIGTNAAGTSGVRNANYGIVVQGGGAGQSVLIGGTTAGARNIISGNGFGGIGLFHNGGTVTIQGNAIGTDVAGTAPISEAIPPTGTVRRQSIGVFVGGESGSGDVIGGVNPGESNLVAFHETAGVFVSGAGNGIAILGNSIFSNGIPSNGFLGIDLGPTAGSFTLGPTANDAGDADGAAGLGRLQNSPQLVNATGQGGTVSIQYSIASLPTNSPYPLRVEFFKADADGQEGQTFLGFDTYTAADATLTKSIAFTPAVSLAAGDRIVATATTADGHTSEFSASATIPASAATTFVVTTTADVVDANDGLLSLREAIIAANATANGSGPDRIHFNLPTSDAGYNASNGPAGAWTFRPTSGQALPTVTEAVVIDGYSQPGTSPNTQATSNDAVLRIELKGQPVFSTPVLRLGSGSSGSSLRGLVINTVNTGIQVDSDNNTIAGNFVGTSVSALAETAFGAVVYDVALLVNGSGNTIGGVTPAERNLIFGLNEGVLLNAAHNARIQGNFIGINRTGTADIIPSGDAGGEGILVNGSNNVTVGGTVAGAGNVISGAVFEGINFEEMGVGNRVQGNLIGTNATGTAAIPNGGDGIAVGGGSAGASFLIGGSEPGARNVISGNVGAGILLGHTAGTVLVQGNLIGPDITGTNPIVLSGVVGRQFVGVFARGSGTGDTIGGINPGEGNIIAFNGFAGVYVQGNRSGVAILGNSMFSNLIPNADNVVLGIDIGPTNGTTGFTPNPNDGGDGDGIAGLNRLQNSPVLTSATLLDDIVSLQYAVDSLPTFAPYPLRIEFFKADADGQEGQTYLGFGVYTAPAATQEVLFDLAPAVAVSPGDKIVATATTADGHTSEFSAFVVVQEPAPTLPAAPTDLIVTNFTATTVSFLWTDNADNETAYEIEQAVGLDSTDFQPVASSPFAADTTNHTETGLTPGTIYYFRVRAVNAAGASDWLTSGNIPLPDVAPAAPTNFMVTGTTTSSVSISWTDNATNETRYEIEQAVGAGSTNFGSVFGGPSPPNTTSRTVIALASGVSYRFRVRAFNSGGVSDWLTSDDILVPIATTTTISSSQNPAGVGQEVTFTAFVNAGGVNPGGTVTFRAGNQVLGTAPVLGSAVATLTTSFPTTGSQVITAVYGGNDPFLTSFSDPLIQAVGSADLGVSIEGPDRVPLGTTVVVRITVTNNGPETATNVVLTDQIDNIPPGVTPGFLFLSAIDDLGNEYTFDGFQLNCPLGTLVAGASATVTVEVTPTDNSLNVGRLRHLATVASDRADLDSTNNTVDFRTLVTRALASVAPGSLDQGFGTGGKVISPLGVFSEAICVATQLDGKTVVGGLSGRLSANGGQIFDFTLARYNTNGSLDSNFGSQGIVVLRMAENSRCADLVIQPDGSIVGIASVAEDFFLARFTSNGSLDASFGAGGAVRTDFGPVDDAQAVTLQPDGKIVVVGATTRTGTIAVARYFPDGTLDPSFSSDGKVRVTNNLLATAVATSVVVQPDGKLLVGGYTGHVSDSGRDYFLVRLLPDGNLDAAFGNGGRVVTPLRLLDDISINAFTFSEIRQLALQRDGKILALGTNRRTGTGATTDFAAVRYLSDGSLDPTFSFDGVVTLDFGFEDVVRGAALRPDGKIVLGGFSAGRFLLTRLNPDGSLDSSFGTQGVARTTLPGGSVFLNDLALHASGKIVAVGSAGSQVALATYHSEHPDVIVTGTDPGGQPRVLVIDAVSGLERFSLLPYPVAFKGGVRVATADVNGDLVPDIITAPGPGIEPRIKVFDGLTGVQLPGAVGSFLAYERRFHGGVFVAAGDCNGDGRADIVTGPGSGLEPRVKVFDALLGLPLAGPRGNFLAYNAGFKGGVTVTTGDINGDGTPDLITGAGPGGFGIVKSFNGLTGQQFPRPLGQLTAFGATHRGGVTVASGDVNGDGRDDIIVAAGAAASTPPRVQVFNGLDGRVLADFFAYDEAFRGGVNVTASDVNGDGRAEIITGAGRGKGQHVRLFDLTRTEIDNFFADELDFAGGVYVAASRTRRR